MLKCASYDIVFQELPHEITLALNLSLCPNRCKGCHSPGLRTDIGHVLTEELLTDLLMNYGSGITAVCFMGGDNDPYEVVRLTAFLKSQTITPVKVGWYSGCEGLPVIEEFPLSIFDYIKLGPYIAEKGPLNRPTTNQRLYRIQDNKMKDITSSFWA